jgi:hypothetical protein
MRTAGGLLPRRNRHRLPGPPKLAPSYAAERGTEVTESYESVFGQAQRLGWDALLPALAWMLENVLHLDVSERPPASHVQEVKWALNIRAAKQVYAGEGSLQAVPRKAVVQLSEPDGSQTTVKLGPFVGNCRRRADKLSPSGARNSTHSPCAGSSSRLMDTPIGHPDRWMGVLAIFDDEARPLVELVERDDLDVLDRRPV